MELGVPRPNATQYPKTAPFVAFCGIMCSYMQLYTTGQRIATPSNVPFILCPFGLYCSVIVPFFSGIVEQIVNVCVCVALRCVLLVCKRGIVGIYTTN